MDFRRLIGVDVIYKDSGGVERPAKITNAYKQHGEEAPVCELVVFCTGFHSTSFAVKGVKNGEGIGRYLHPDQMKFDDEEDEPEEDEPKQVGDNPEAEEVIQDIVNDTKPEASEAPKVEEKEAKEADAKPEAKAKEKAEAEEKPVSKAASKKKKGA